MRRPEPGIFLFVGGPADGDRRFVSQPRDRYEVVVFPDMCTAVTHDPVPIKIDYDKVVYQLECLREEHETFWCYMYGRKYRGGLIAALLDGYRRA